MYRAGRSKTGRSARTTRCSSAIGRLVAGISPSSTYPSRLRSTSTRVLFGTAGRSPRHRPLPSRSATWTDEPEHRLGRARRSPVAPLPRHPRWDVAAATARRSTRSLKGSELWPFTHLKRKRPGRLPVKVDQGFPQVAVRHRLSGRAGPTLCDPLLPPTVPKTIDDVGAVAHYLQRPRQRAGCIQGSRDLHALVGAPSGGAAAPAPAGHSPGPTARARVAQASTVCVHLRSWSWLLGAPSSACVITTSMAGAPAVLAW